MADPLEVILYAPCIYPTLKCTDRPEKKRHAECIVAALVNDKEACMGLLHEANERMLTITKTMYLGMGD